jgi:hypothetical protein
MIKKSTDFRIPAFLFMLGAVINFWGDDFVAASLILFLLCVSFIHVNKYEHLETYHPEPVRLLMRRK